MTATSHDFDPAPDAPMACTVCGRMEWRHRPEPETVPVPVGIAHVVAATLRADGHPTLADAIAQALAGTDTDRGD